MIEIPVLALAACQLFWRFVPDRSELGLVEGGRAGHSGAFEAGVVGSTRTGPDDSEEAQTGARTAATPAVRELPVTRYRCSIVGNVEGPRITQELDEAPHQVTRVRVTSTWMPEVAEDATPRLKGRSSRAVSPTKHRAESR
eukprot:Polyplicarium_translucidae@DN1406_c0_g1_i5.p1